MIPGLALLVASSPVVASPPSSPTIDTAPLETIIVTARRREEALQRTPVSIIALTAKELEARSVTNLRSLQNFVPNLTFAPSQGVGEAAGNIFIRGIGQEDFGAAAEPGVGFYVDGVYFARTTGAIMNLVDIDRVEVLRGPQGTLYGKNTIGGAINVISKPPAAKPETNLDLILGNLGRGEARAVVNWPLAENLFLRLAVGGVRRDGYLRRLTPDASLGPLGLVTGHGIDLHREGSERSAGGRLQLRWRVGDSLTADLSIDGSSRRGSQGAIHIDAIDPRFGVLPQINRLIAAGSLPGPLITAELVPNSLFESHAGGANRLRQDLAGGALTLSKRLGGAELKLIAAQRSLRSDTETDTDGLYFALTDQRIWVRQRQWSGELQLTGTSGRLAYTAGLFRFGEWIRILPVPTVMNAILFTCGCAYPPGTRPRSTVDRRRLTSDSQAAYAQGSYRLTDRLSATLGARYSRDRKRIDGIAYQIDANLRPTDIVVGEGHNRGAWSSFTYRAGAEFQATPNLMTYGSVARGFKSGGFNARTSLALPNLGYAAYRPETALTVEGGLRSEWLKRRLRFNLTLFQTHYDQMQVRVQTISGGLVTTLVENAGKARIRGVEVEIAAKPARGVRLTAAYGHLDPAYRKIGQVEGLTLSSRFQRTPSHSLTASVDLETPAHGGTVALHADWSYRSKEQFQIAPAVNDQPGYALLGARIGWRSVDGRRSLALFGANLTDKHYRTAGRGTQIEQTGIIFSSVGLPRQIGIEALLKY